MRRRNGEVMRVRQAVSVARRPELEGRVVCLVCGGETPRGQDRPFCLEHAPYARALRQALLAR